MNIEKLNNFMNEYGKLLMFALKENGMEIIIIDDMVDSSDIYFIPKHEKLDTVLNEIIEKYPQPIC